MQQKLNSTQEEFMFKRTLSILLCVAITLCTFSCLTIGTSAANNAKSIFAVTSSPVKNNLLRYTINITSQQKGIAGALLEVKFDSSVLKPVLCEPATTTTEGNGTQKNFEGNYAYGITENDPNTYSIAYMNSVVVSTNAHPKAFFNIVFEVIDVGKPQTNLSFYCKEYLSTSDPEKNITNENGPQEIAVYENVATLEAPQLVSLEHTLEGFDISWKPVSGAKSYVVYRSSPSSAREPLQEVYGENNTTYSDKTLQSGVSYTYTVTAVNNYGQSAFDSVGLTKMFVSKPQIEYVKNLADGVEIRWGATAGATQYNIMRRVKGESQWNRIGIRVANIDTVYKDSTVKDGTKYEYDIVSATDSFESAVAQTGTEILYIKAPVIKSLVNVFGGIELKWNAHSDATSYTVYKKIIGVDSELRELTECNTTTFTDTNVEAGKSYTYSVKVNTNDGESAYNSTGYTIVCVPSTKVTALDTNNYSISVSWQPISGVDGYYIYRKPATSENWIKLGTAKKDASSYEDKIPDSGVQYVYAVCPIIAGSESVKNPSDPIYFIKSPEAVKAVNEKDGISISWKKVNGAASYNIYRKQADSDTVQIATISTNSYLDQNVFFDNTYTYSVVAVNPMGSSKNSMDSNSLLRLDAIGKTTASIPENGVGIKVTWEPSVLAEKYALYRFNGTQWLMLTELKDTEYTDVNVISDENYAYAVAAIKGTSIGILNTDSPQYIKYIAPVTTIDVANGADCSKVTWNAVAGATIYYVYKSNAVDGSYKMVATIRGNDLSYTDKSVVEGTEVFYKVRCHNGENYSAFSIAKRNVFLSRVTVKSVQNSYGGQTIKWNSVKGATGYRVYNNVNGKGYVLLTVVPADTLTYFDKTAVNGSKMTYAVRAINGESVSAYKVKSAVYVAAPKLTVSNSSSGITLKWDKNDVATSYNIYRKVNGKGGWKKIDNVQTTSYVDKDVKSGNTYKYTVRAYKGKYISGYNSNGWSIVRLSNPSLKSVSNGYNNLKFSWGSVVGAKSYYVYRKAEGEKNWTRIATTTKTYYQDKKVTNRNVYTYTVRACNGSSTSGYYSSGKTGRYIEAPKLNVQNATTGIYITWNRISGANSYYLYRKAGNAKKWTKLGTVTGDSYLDTNVKEGVVYKYTIRAYGSKTLSGYNGKGWSTMFLKTPDLNSAKVYGSGIQVKWSKVSYATSYYVYRKEKGDSTWTRIATVKGTSYVDKNVEFDETYTYTVRAISGSYKSFYKSTGISCRFR